MFCSTSRFSASKHPSKINLFVLSFFLVVVLDPANDFVLAFFARTVAFPRPSHHQYFKSFDTFTHQSNENRNSILVQLKVFTDTPAGIYVNGDTDAYGTRGNHPSHSNNNERNNNQTAFSLLASLAAICILESEMKKDAIRADGSQTPSSAANWIDDRSAYAIQSALDQIELKVRFLFILLFLFDFDYYFNLLFNFFHHRYVSQYSQLGDQRVGFDADEARAWLRWMKATPVSLVKLQFLCFFLLLCLWISSLYGKIFQIRYQCLWKFQMNLD
jgi:hypothetical protein